MTVKELKELLSNFADDVDICVDVKTNELNDEFDLSGEHSVSDSGGTIYLWADE